MSTYKAGFVGLIGQPNAGKSTLLNQLVKEKISIVTAKPQTTRRRILGVVTKPAGQIVFVDAPGLVRANEGLNAFLHREIQDVMSSSDVLLVVVSLTEKKPEDVTEILELARSAKKPLIVIVTKADVVEKKHRLMKIKELVEAAVPGTKVFEYSSKWKGDGDQVLHEIEDAALALLPSSPAPLYDTEIFTPHTVKDLASEIIREQCFEALDKEIPYGIAVRIVKFDESNPKLPKIYADIVVPKDSQKMIVVGKAGSTIKQISMKSREQIQKMMGSKLFLKLEVVVREDWALNNKFMKDLGYVVEQK